MTSLSDWPLYYERMEGDKWMDQLKYAARRAKEERKNKRKERS